MARSPAVSQTLVFLLIVLTASCAATQRSDPVEEPLYVESNRSYLRALGLDVEYRYVGQEFLSCYDVEADSLDEANRVQLVLSLSGDGVTAEVVQNRSELSETFLGCVEDVAVGWRADLLDRSTQETVEIQFGPLEGDPMPAAE